MGYAALPAIAWHIVFGMPERLMPRGGLGRMLTPMTSVIAGAAIARVSNNWRNSRGQSDGPGGGPNDGPPTPNSGGGSMPSNSPQPVAPTSYTNPSAIYPNTASVSNAPTSSGTPTGNAPHQRVI